MNNSEENDMKNKKIDWGYFLSLFISVFAALLVGAIIMLITGHDPISAYGETIKGAFGSPRVIGNTLAKSVTLCMTGIATAIGAYAGIFNVGGEGQLYLGGMASAIIGYTCYGLSPVIAIPLAFIAAMAAGAFYAYIPAVLKVKFKVDEVIVTVMMNSIAIYLCSYLANGPLKTSEKGIASGTPAIDPNFRFPSIIPNSSLTTTIFIAAVITILVWYLMRKTSQGFEMKITGQNSRFAFFSGMKSDKSAIWAMIISGAMCGIVGLFEVYATQGRFKPDLSNEFYFDGMLVAMIMRYNPIGIVFMSLFFGAMKVGASAMELNSGVSSELILVIQSIIIFFMAAERGITSTIKSRIAVKKQRMQLNAKLKEEA